MEFVFDLSPEQIAQARVIIVDDEPLVTTSLSSFLSLELDIAAIVFNTPTEAANYIKANDADLVVSDFLMPEMDGIELLRIARDIRPQMPRILLTGYADKENAIRAINEVRVFQYLEKPWENQQLKNIIINALEKQTLLRVLASRAQELTATREDLVGLRKALVRAFA